MQNVNCYVYCLGTDNKRRGLELMMRLTTSSDVITPDGGQRSPDTSPPTRTQSRLSQTSYGNGNILREPFNDPDMRHWTALAEKGIKA